MFSAIPTPWKVGTFAFAALSLGLMAKVVTLNHETNGLLRDLEATKTSLIIAQDNEKRLEGAISDQNIAIATVSAESTKRLAAANAALVEAKKETRIAQRKADLLLHTPIKGDTLEERIRDVDAKVLEGLK